MIDNFWPILILGLMLGIRHAFDADHVVAVTTLIAKSRNPLKAAATGAFWGLGHTSTLFLVGLIVLLFRVNIPESVALTLELLVSAMLIFLGVRSILKKDETIHEHKHDHNDDKHSHVHAHIEEKNHGHHQSFLIGSVHGLAGSAALMLLVLTTVKSLPEGLIYILIFGLGSVGGMSAISFILCLPYIMAFKKFPGMHGKLMKITGVLSIMFGIILAYEILLLSGI